jgi:hypothetical protein
MNDLEYIALFQKLAHKALLNTYLAFKGNTKLILTESDLKCRIYLELQKLIDNQLGPNLSVHSEVTHYSGNLIENRNNRLRKEYFMRDLTILDADKLRLNNEFNSELWNETNNQNGLSKGFKHTGPALHFELKLLRQPIQVNGRVLIDAGDVEKLNNVNALNRAYTIVIGSKNNNLNEIELSVNNVLNNFNNNALVLNNLLRIYLFDNNEMKVFNVQNGALSQLFENNY